MHAPFCNRRDYSAGSAVAGLLQLKDQLTKDDVVVEVIHDHGSRYVGKIYNDDWMRERGFIEKEMTVKELLSHKSNNEFLAVSTTDTVRHAFDLMKAKDISQMPVMDENETLVGSLTESNVLSFLLENPMQHSTQKVKDIMGDPFPMVSLDLPFSHLNKFINKKISAVLVKNPSGQLQILTQYDIIQAI